MSSDPGTLTLIEAIANTSIHIDVPRYRIVKMPSLTIVIEQDVDFLSVEGDISGIYAAVPEREIHKLRSPETEILTGPLGLVRLKAEKGRLPGYLAVFICSLAKEGIEGRGVLSEDGHCFLFPETSIKGAIEVLSQLISSAKVGNLHILSE